MNYHLMITHIRATCEVFKDEILHYYQLSTTYIIGITQIKSFYYIKINEL